MDELFTKFRDQVDLTVKSFLNQLCEKHNLDKKETEKLWTEMNKKKSNIIETLIADSSKSIKLKETCLYIFRKGTDVKDTRCQIKPKNGEKYCAAHKKYEGKELKPQKILPDLKKGGKEEEEEEEQESQTVPKKKGRPKKVVNEPPKPSDSSRIIRPHVKSGKLWHAESGLAFEKGGKEVVGMIKNDKFVSGIDDEVANLAKKYGFMMKKETSKEKEIESDSDVEMQDKESLKTTQKKVNSALGISDCSSSSSDDSEAE